MLVIDPKRRALRVALFPGTWKGEERKVRVVLERERKKEADGRG